MQINRDNYEIILIDYLDGKLSLAERQVIEAFLMANPDIAMEFEALQTFTPVSDSVKFDQKEQLLKIPFAKSQADDDFFTQKCIEKIEGILPVTDEPAFEKMVESNPDAFRSYSLFRKTRLPLEHFNYDEKIVIKINESHPVLNETNFAGYAIAYFEGWLNPSAEAEVNRYIKNNPEAEHTFQTIQKLKLIPDNQIVFPGKEALKKQRSIGQQFRKQITYWGSVAAVIAIGAFAFYLTDNDHQHVEQAMVTNETLPKQEIKQPVKVSTEAPVSHLVTEQKKPVVSHSIEESPVKKLNSVAEISQSNLKSELISLNTIPTIALNQIDNNSAVLPDLQKNDAGLIAREKELLTAEYKLLNTAEETDSTTSEKLLRKAVRYGMNKLVAASHGHIKIQQKEDEKKTKIEVDTRYFAFSTTTKQINF